MTTRTEQEAARSTAPKNNDQHGNWWSRDLGAGKARGLFSLLPSLTAATAATMRLSPCAEIDLSC
jgi:hypothetical protein